MKALRAYRKYIAIFVPLVLAAIAGHVCLRDPEVAEGPIGSLIARVHGTFNTFEAVFWVVVGPAFLWKSRSLSRHVRPPAIVAGCTFIVFAGSDVAELSTGTWYSPWWLFVWNAVCVVTLVSCLVWYLALRRESPD